MSSLHWYKRFPHNALEGMMQLTLEERGAYNTVLDLIYLRGGKLQDDERFIAGWLRVDVRVWRRIRTTLFAAKKLHSEDGFLTNDRATIEVDAALHRVASASDAGKASAAKRNGAESKNKDLAPATVPTESQPSKGLGLGFFEDPSLQTKAVIPPSPPDGGATVVKFPRKKREGDKTTIPDNFAMTPAMYTYAAEHAKWERPRVDIEFGRFCEHHRFKGTLGRNWVAGWQNWVRNGAKYDMRDLERDKTRPQFNGHGQVNQTGQL